MLLQVVCSGHSLGAALASLCAVWASVQYPNADVLSVTIGQASLRISSLACHGQNCSLTVGLFELHYIDVKLLV